MNEGGLLVVLTAVIAALVVVMLFAVLRFFAATRGAKRRLRDAGTETTLLSHALQEAVSKLKAQEQEMRARAHESEALSEHIVDSLTAGLVVVGLDGRVRDPQSGRLPASRGGARCGGPGLWGRAGRLSARSSS